ncbi:MAG: hypothetical protein JWQ06_1305 [Mucilaginibacter sp.]|nr:hypothetical protein [Mucilaginibacter sp.]
MIACEGSVNGEWVKLLVIACEDTVNGEKGEMVNDCL